MTSSRFEWTAEHDKIAAIPYGKRGRPTYAVLFTAVAAAGAEAGDDRFDADAG